MLRRVIYSTALVALIALAASSTSRACDERDTGNSGERRDETVYSVTVHSRQTIDAQTPSKLSPALLATKDGNGVLKGADDAGKPLIAVSDANVEKIRTSRAVRSISTEVPDGWTPVTRLKVSYIEGKRPSEKELSELGLKLVEDYGKGSFMIVEPLAGQVDADLAAKLEDNPKVRYVTPSFAIKVIQPRQR